MEEKSLFVLQVFIAHLDVERTRQRPGPDEVTV